MKQLVFIAMHPIYIFSQLGSFTLSESEFFLYSVLLLNMNIKVSFTMSQSEFF